MSDDKKRLLELEREFRATVISELRSIKDSQGSLISDFDSLDKRVSLSIQKVKNELGMIHHLDESQNKMLDEHIKRSRYLEDLIDMLREKEIAPLKKHVSQVEGALKLVGALGVVVSIVTGFLKLSSLI